MKRTVIFFITILSNFVYSQHNVISENLKYLKQEPPSMTPEVFAPNIISKKGRSEYGSVFSKDGTEFFYATIGKRHGEIKYTQLVDSTWSIPITLVSNEKFECADPFLSPDEKRLYFISGPPKETSMELFHIDIWYVEKTEDGWSEPINAGANINSNKNEFYISFTQDGSMYFSSNRSVPDKISNFEGSSYHDIYKSEYVNGTFQKAIPVGDSINTIAYEADAFIDPEERYIIFGSNRKEGFGAGDLYISFKKEDGIWTESKNMGAPVNSKGHELCPFVSKDGKYLFYTSKGDIHWVDAQIIDQCRDTPNLKDKLTKTSLAIELLSVIETKGIVAAIRYFNTNKDAENFDLNEKEMDEIGYRLMANGNVEGAAKVFKLNVDAFPKSSNTYDSYAEALMKLSKNELAIENYKKSVAMDITNENGIKNLKKLGVDTSKLIKKIVVPSHILEQYVGNYEMRPGLVFYISKEGDQMKLKPPGQPEVDIFPKSDNVFYPKVIKAEIIFNRDSNGEVESLTFSHGEREMTGKKLTE